MSCLSGAGQVISDPCRSCNGDGRVQQSKVLSVSVPAGVDTGTRIRLSGKGEAGMRGGSAGDLYIFVAVDPHPILTRDGADIMTRIPLPMTTAALGGTIDVPTVEGKMARLTIRGWNPVRPSFPYARQGYAHSAAQQPRRPDCRGAGRNAYQPDKKAKGIAGGICRCG